jgi:hypothetical protein
VKKSLGPSANRDTSTHSAESKVGDGDHSNILIAKARNRKIIGKRELAFSSTRASAHPFVQCMNLINELFLAHEISKDTYIKATRVFRSKQHQLDFIRMSGDQRRSWLSQFSADPMVQCMNLINELFLTHEISKDTYIKATKAFRSKQHQLDFIRMSGDQRRSWLSQLSADPMFQCMNLINELFLTHEISKDTYIKAVGEFRSKQLQLDFIRMSGEQRRSWLSQLLA